MTVIFESGYSLPGADQPLNHARLAHASTWATGGTVSASSTDADYFADAPDTTLTYEKWKPTSVAAWWQYAHTGSRSFDYCCVAAHTMGTNGNTFKVQYDSGGGTWADLTADTAIADDSPIFAIFEPVTATNMRIYITGGTAPTIGVVKFGTAMQFRRPFFSGHAPGGLARQTILRSNYSETGEILGRSKQRTYMQTSFDWRHLPRTWVNSEFREFQLAMEEEPFWIAWRPDDYDDVLFGIVDEVPIPSYMGVRDLMQVSFTMRARGYD